jgi:sigma-B regulation protein RsbU (phosphoserine phosphatase)
MDVNALKSALDETADLLRSVSAIHDPQELQRAFSTRMRDLSGTDGYIAISRRGLTDGRFKITREMLDPESIEANPVNPWVSWNDLAAHSGGWIGGILDRDEPRMFTDLRLRGDPVLGDRLDGFHSALVIPLYDEGESINWSVMLRRDPGAFTQDELQDLLLRGNLIGRMTRNLVIRKEVERLNTRLTQQFEEIAQIQMSLLPQKTPSVAGLDIATSYLTSNEAGGDYFDFFEFKDGRFGVVIADVSGHGAGAATIMAMLQTMLHNHAHDDATPGELLCLANQSLVSKRLDGNFVTAFFAVIDPDRKRITYANAGHHAPLRHRGDGSIDQLSPANAAPLGVVEEMEFVEDQTELAPGDTLVLFTDGITEAFSPAPEREMFGMDGLRDSLSSCTGMPACVVDSIHTALYEHTGSRLREDDQTIVTMRITGP